MNENEILELTGDVPETVAVPDHVARIYGEPLAQLPLDLYIPPDAMAVMLDAFEGPLDLLLHLIETQELDISAISLMAVTDQYLKTMAQLEEIEQEDAESLKEANRE